MESCELRNRGKAPTPVFLELRILKGLREKCMELRILKSFKTRCIHYIVYYSELRIPKELEAPRGGRAWLAGHGDTVSP